MTDLHFAFWPAKAFFFFLRCLGLVFLFALPPLEMPWPMPKTSPKILKIFPKSSFGSALWAQAPANPARPKPQPYNPNEFAPFWQQLRRFEVVLIGSIPITLLLGSLVYDIVFTIAQPNVNEFTVATREQDILQKIGISISISGLLAVLDMAIHLGHRNRERKERERILRESEFLQSSPPKKPGESKAPGKLQSKNFAVRTGPE